MDQTPPFDEAVDAFGRFLAQEGWSSSIVWRRPDDIVGRIGKGKVVRRRSFRRANTWARQYYESGLSQGLGIALSAECEVGGAVCATVFWTADEQEAQQLMMPTRGLKMSAALPRARGRSVSWLGWWLARKKLALIHKAIAPEGARHRRNT
jgi:hypothetical protein